MLRRKPLWAVWASFATALLLSTTVANAVPASSVPGAPQNVQATRGNTSVTIRWAAPANDGGSALTQYQIVGTNGLVEVSATPAPTASSYTFTTLTNGSSYSFIAFAVNAVGISAPSDTVNMTPSTTAPKAPAVPTVQSVDTSVSRTLTINYTLGSSNGSTISAVSYSMDNGVSWRPVVANPLVISGITNGVVYPFKLRETNLIGSAILAKSVKAVATKNYIDFATPAPLNYGESETLEVGQTGGTSVAISRTPLICTVSALEVIAIKPGTCGVTVSNSGDAEFAAATAVSRAFTVSKAPNAITLQPLVNMAINQPNQVILSTAAGGSIVVSSATASVCTVVNGAIHPLTVGTCTISLTNPGNTNFLAAASLTRSILITTAVPSPSATATPTASPTSYACAEDAAQLCGPVSNISVSVDGINRSISAAAVTVDVGKPVRFGYTSSALNAGKRVLITLESFSTGLTSSVSHTVGDNPWSSSACYPDGATTQCQLMLDVNGSGYFVATFTGSSAGASFQYKQRGPGYASDAVTATFATGSSATPTATASATPSATPTATRTATPSASPTPVQSGPWTIRQTTFSNSDYALDTGTASLWVGYGWYSAGLHYGTVHLPVSSTKTVSFHVADGLGNSVANKSVTLIIGKGWSNSTAHVRVGSVTTNGIDAGTGAHQATVSALTDISGNVSFAITNLDPVGSSLYTQISAYVADVGKDVVDIINIAYDQAPAPTPQPSPSMSLLWQDDFSGAAGGAPNSSYWTADLQDGCSSGNCGWGNGEREWYTADANKLNGTSGLVMTANKLSASTAPDCYYGKCTWSSGKLTTYGKVNFTYGYLEARIKNPAGGGTWPAFWMLGQDIASRAWPLCGEIDIMEGEGNAPYTNWGTAHWANTNPGDHIQGPGNNTVTLSSKLSDNYHTYGMLWTPTSLTWYIDGAASYTLNKASVPSNLWPFGPTTGGADPKFYAILNVAMGGGMGGNIDSALTTTNMTVDYVKYYSVNGQGKVTLTP
jgi:beta-glucanase (GH16 family)